MITGEVTPDREAVILLRVRSPGGGEMELDALLDTGFTDFLSLPPEVIAELQLPFREVSEFTLADGSTVRLEAYTVTVIWEGEERTVLALGAESDPLAGMALLHGSRVMLDVVDGGEVRIEPLP